MYKYCTPSTFSEATTGTVNMNLNWTVKAKQQSTILETLNTIETPTTASYVNSNIHVINDTYRHM